MVDKSMLISINDVDFNNIGKKLIQDFIIMLFIPFTLVVIYRKRLMEFKLQFKHTYLQYILIAIMLALFLLHRDFTIKGYYEFFLYLFVVSFGEELIFRGYVYNELLKHNKLFAIIISGLFWGITHAILPGILAENGLGEIGLTMLSEIIGGIVLGYYFIYILEKSKSLFIPIFIHAILNYSVGGIGLITAIGTWLYLYKLEKNKSPATLYKAQKIE